MESFDYQRAADKASAISMLDARPTARFLAGGTNLVDLMREGIERPGLVVDVTGLSSAIEETADGGVRIGAAATNTAVAEHSAVRQRYPVLARAILSGASGQIRNMATVGGNLLQRTRCPYFYDETARCNKRSAGAGCDAIEGFNRNHAILGASSSCVAVFPSDMCVALAALDATIEIERVTGSHTVAMTEFHRLPGSRPDIETVLGQGDLITSVTLPASPIAVRSTYRKVRDRSSYAFALVSVAAALDLKGGVVTDVRIALGGLAHKPWRAYAAEDALRGQFATADSFRGAAEEELAGAVPLRDNGFKIELAKRTIVAVLEELAG